MVAVALTSAFLAWHQPHQLVNRLPKIVECLLWPGSHLGSSYYSSLSVLSQGLHIASLFTNILLIVGFLLHLAGWFSSWYYFLHTNLGLWLQTIPSPDIGSLFTFIISSSVSVNDTTIIISIVIIIYCIFIIMDFFLLVVTQHWIEFPCLQIVSNLLETVTEVFPKELHTCLCSLIPAVLLGPLL